MKTELAKKYLRLEKLPTLWCSGCGHGLILSSLLRALYLLNIEKDKVAMVSGIGCSGRTPGYVDVHTLHTTHGRAIPFATGIKLMKPEFYVLAVMGDGDCAAIGGNHFIHAARRNIDITAIVYNNGIYGMTGGQVSPTTPYGAYASTAPYGQLEEPFDIVELALGAGATFVARSSIDEIPKLDRLIADGIKHKGFSVIDVITICPITFGRRNKLGEDPMMNLRWVQDITVPMKKAKDMSKEELKGKWITGIFRDEDKPNLIDLYLELNKKLKHSMVDESSKEGVEDVRRQDET
ncbi:MAG: 2-oxoacid:ferredoxin oxidoreductase subunit beta [Candidatus Stahlbacteria bacterium]|nr:MAG: 2-oxoacid:ferredoxin oxidoreductase subunit beta [Candidatus Stahlbacteria bacterium]